MTTVVARRLLLAPTGRSGTGASARSAVLMTVAPRGGSAGPAGRLAGCRFRPRLGGDDDAVVEAAARAGLKGGYGVRRIEQELSWAQQLLFQVRSTGESMLARIGIARSGAAQLMQRLKPLDLEIARWVRLSSPACVAWPWRKPHGIGRVFGHICGTAASTEWLTAKYRIS